MINNYTLSQSHHWSQRSEAARPITIALQMEGRFFRESCCCPEGAEQHERENNAIFQMSIYVYQLMQSWYIVWI